MIDNQLEEQILKASIGLINQYGYNKTTMQDIAKAVNRTKSALYHYYKSKEEIFLAIIKNEAETFLQRLMESVQDIQEPAQKLKAYLENRLKGISTIRNYYGTLKTQYYQQHEAIEQLRQKYDAIEKNFILQLLQEGQEKNIFTIENPEAAVLGITIALKGIEIWIIERGEGGIIENVENFLSLLFNGIMRK